MLQLATRNIIHNRQQRKYLFGVILGWDFKAEVKHKNKHNSTRNPIVILYNGFVSLRYQNRCLDQVTHLIFILPQQRQATVCLENPKLKIQFHIAV